MPRQDRSSAGRTRAPPHLCSSPPLLLAACRGTCWPGSTGTTMARPSTPDTCRPTSAGGGAWCACARACACACSRPGCMASGLLTARAACSPAQPLADQPPTARLLTLLCTGAHPAGTTGTTCQRPTLRTSSCRCTRTWQRRQSRWPRCRAKVRVPCPCVRVGGRVCGWVGGAELGPGGCGAMMAGGGGDAQAQAPAPHLCVRHPPLPCPQAGSSVRGRPSRASSVRLRIPSSLHLHIGPPSSVQLAQLAAQRSGRYGAAPPPSPPSPRAQQQSPRSRHD